MSDLQKPPSSPVNPTSPKPYINTRSAHNVMLWLKGAKADGRLKDCWNLKVDRISMRDDNGVDTGESYFVPVCTEQSFESNFAHIDDENQLEILRRNLNSNPVSCPQNCTCYQNRKRVWVLSEIKRGFRRLRVAGRITWKAFLRLQWPQVVVIGMIALIIILLKAPQWVPLLVSLAKAIWGKTP